MIEYSIIRSVILEMIGSFAIIYFSTITVDLSSKSPDEFSIEIQNSLLTLLFIWMPFMWICGRLSGGQFNPAISVSLLISRNLSLTNFICHIGAQTLGAFIAFLALSAISEKLFIYTNISTNFLSTFFLEFLLSFIISFSYLFTFVAKNADRAIYGFVVPASQIFVVISMAKFYYSSVNLLGYLLGIIFGSGAFGHIIWVSFGSLAGCVTAGILYKLFFEDESENEISNEYILNEESEFKF